MSDDDECPSCGVIICEYPCDCGGDDECRICGGTGVYFVCNCY